MDLKTAKDIAHAGQVTSPQLAPPNTTPHATLPSNGPDPIQPPGRTDIRSRLSSWAQAALQGRRVTPPQTIVVMDDNTGRVETVRHPGRIFIDTPEGIQEVIPGIMQPKFTRRPDGHLGAVENGG